jgi:hypothetical protein
MTRAGEVWLETLRRLTPERKLELVLIMMEEGLSFRVAGVRIRFPHFTEEEARARAKEEAIACYRKTSLRKSPLF